MTIKLPRFHLDNVVTGTVNKVRRFSKRQFEEVDFRTIKILMTVLPDFINKVSSGLLSIVRYRGLEPEFRRKLGPDWEKRLDRAVWHDVCSALHFVNKVTLEQRYFWDDSRDWFGPNVKHLDGTFHLLNILSSAPVSLRIGDSGQHITYDWKYYGMDYMFKAAKEKHSDVYQQWEDSGFRSPNEIGVLVFTKTLIHDLGLNVANYSLGGQQISIADLLTQRPRENELVLNGQANDSEVWILDSDGVSDVSMALGLVYRFNFETTTVTRGLDVRSCYVNWSGEADPQLRALQLEIWLGIPFVLPGHVSEFGSPGPFGSGPSGPDDLSPQSGGSGQPGPSGPFSGLSGQFKNKEGPESGPTTGKTGKRPPGPIIPGGVKGLAGSTLSSATKALSNDVPGIIQRTVVGYLASGGNLGSALGKAAYPYIMGGLPPGVTFTPDISGNTNFVSNNSNPSLLPIYQDNSLLGNNVNNSSTNNRRNKRLQITGR